jgi:hypothetical protein
MLIFANRIVTGQVHLALHLRPLCPGVSHAHLNVGERRRLSDRPERGTGEKLLIGRVSWTTSGLWGWERAGSERASTLSCSDSDLILIGLRA